MSLLHSHNPDTAAGEAGKALAAGTERGGRWRRLGEFLGAILRQRCPRCRTGRMFRGVLAMNDVCPVCGLLFQREEGYFLGAMYISYALATAFLVTSYFVTAALLPDWNTMLIALVAVLPYLPLVPVVFRYSRVIWIHIDRLDSTGDRLANSYERSRQRQLTGPKSP